MTYGFIYKIQFPNGKHYIGLTATSLEKRQREHKTYAKNGDTKVLYPFPDQNDGKLTKLSVSYI